MKILKWEKCFLFMYYFWNVSIRTPPHPTPFFCHLIVATAAQLQPAAMLKNNRSNVGFTTLLA